MKEKENEKKIVEIDSLSAGYDGKTVIQNIQLTIAEKDFIGIIGPNGGGKTTLLKVIIGLIKPISGKVTFFENLKPVSHIQIGYLPQINSFDRKFPITVMEVVLSGLMSKNGFFKRIPKADKEKAKELLNRMGVYDYRNRSIGELSGGLMQRVFLSRAMIASPKLLILDEPNTYVDNNFEHELFDILVELNKELTIIVVSHDVGTIFSYIKTIACINRELYYHPSNQITNELLKHYNCPIDLITHGAVPHRVLHKHLHQHEETMELP
jgi:zinc transport system ATP-binding protein